MNKRDILSANLRRDLALASPRFQRVSISTMPWYFLKLISFGIPVTFLFWCTYLVVNLTSNGESIWAARGLLVKQLNCSVTGKGANDE
jgi:hypothetical protein